MRNLITSLIAGVLTFLFIACSEENSTVFPVEGSVENISSSLQEIETSSSSIFSSNTAISSSSWEPYSYGKLIDERDGHIYKTIKIGEQTWMAENLKYKDSLFTWGEAIDQKTLLENNDDKCSDLKRIYYYPCNNIPYIGAKGVCPENWHIPTKKEQTDLIQYANESTEKFDALAHYWLFGGIDQNISDINSQNLYFWISEESDRSNSKFYISTSETESFIFSLTEKKIQQKIFPKSTKMSIRCVKDEDTIHIEHGELKDERDGQVYKTIKIGNQWWMAENLNYDDSISLCYNNELGNCTKYGRLYSWDAAMDCKSFENTDECYKHHYNNSKLGKISRGICPMGWHMPSEEDFSNIMKLTNENVDAIISTYGWNNDKNGSDILGLEILPAGMYSSNENLWIEVGEFSYFWTTLQLTIGLSFESKDVIADEAFACSISSQDNVISLDEHPKFDGYSIRCTKDE